VNAPDLFMKRAASISACGSFRWTLTREWGEGPKVCYIGHNPSIADASVDDPTVQAWIALAKANGYTGLVAVNLFPLRTPDVKECARWAAWDKNGPDWWARDRIHQNMGVVAREAKRAAIVVACWGALCTDDGHVEAVIEEIQAGEEPYPDLYCLGRTGAGYPKHPMARGKHRIPRDHRFELWRRAN
jgi:hypothetical protein